VSIVGNVVTPTPPTLPRDVCRMAKHLQAHLRYGASVILPGMVSWRLQSRLITASLHRPANKAVFTGALLLSFPRGVDAWSVSHGGCVFTNGPDEELQRTGSCSAQTGSLYLCGYFGSTSCPARDSKIKSLSAGVFDDMQAMTELRLTYNQLATLENNTFVGLGSLTHLYMNNNQLTGAAAGAFAGLPELRTLYIYWSSLNTAGNGGLACLPMGSAAFAALTTYYGPPRCEGYEDPEPEEAGACGFDFVGRGIDWREFHSCCEDKLFPSCPYLGGNERFHVRHRICHDLELEKACFAFLH
jgi:hypothetical protein